jgi:hypothetical protein
MQPHCDAWIAATRAQAPATSKIVSTAIHVAWSTVPRTQPVPVVVVFRLEDGSTVYEPVFCGVHVVPDPACDLSDVSMPPQ